MRCHSNGDAVLRPASGDRPAHVGAVLAAVERRAGFDAPPQRINDDKLPYAPQNAGLITVHARVEYSHVDLLTLGSLP